jgi:hypothetical protein
VPQYGIYVLGESQLTISNGRILDGVTQGDGSHLAGQTITLNSNAWRQILINDNNASFDDNDTSQTLAGAQSVDGTSFASGTRVEAEYTLVVTHAGQNYTLVGFNLNNSSPAYATIEGLAFIGGPGGFPPVGVPLRVTSTREGPTNFQATQYATPICFASGTRIAVPGGTRAVEDLRPGDRVCTLHHGVQRLVWCGASLHAGQGAAAPVRFAAGAIGNDRALTVSPQHRIWQASARAELFLGAAEVLIPALHFLGRPGVARVIGGSVRYHHLMCEDHEVLFAEDAPSESFHPGPQALKALDPAARQDLERCHPGAGFGTTVARPLRRHESAAVLAA